MRDNNQSRIQSFAFVISICMAACLSLAFILNVTQIDSKVGVNEDNIESRINPNIAPIASLIRLPDVGLLRADAIVTYREQLHVKEGKKRVFKDINDLKKVKGIGHKTVQNISEWLSFE